MRMTIAACYVSPEGIVLGADSTSTYGDLGELHYNNAQKLFEIGENSTLGIVTWGLGGLQVSSHRTLVAALADDLKNTPAASVLDAATRWGDVFWAAYSDPSCPIAPFIQQCKHLNTKPAFDPAAVTPAPGARTEDEEKQFQQLKQRLVVGFCIAGYVLPSRTPHAFEIVFDPLQGKPTPQSRNGQWFWGAPNMINRLLKGCDDVFMQRILASGKWAGSPTDLLALIQQQTLTHPIVPIRDAIDFTHACILSTIKAFKFSGLSPICGGPIEIAVITTDRRFRWVRHKRWDTAITEGGHDVEVHE
jgi:hypothetical protein